MIQTALRFAAWLALATIVFVTVSPIGLRPQDVLPVNTDRALAFCVLGALFVLAYPRQWLLVGLAVTLAAIGIEWLQELSPTRHARLDDALIKAAGAAVGVLIGRAASLILRRFGKSPVAAE